MPPIKPKIIFWGTPEFAVPVLQALIKNDFLPALVVTQPDKPVGRKQQLTPPPVKEFALANNIAVLQPQKKKDFAAVFADNDYDLCILAAYGLIIPDEYLNKPKFGFLNIHPSLLPQYRGSAPIQQAILNGDKVTGVSIIKLVQAVDAGPIFSQKEVPLLPTDNAQTLSLKLAQIGAELLVEILPDYLAGKISPASQSENLATYTEMIDRNDGRIDWQQTAEQIGRQFRAFYPWPGIFAQLDGKRLKIANLSVLGGDFASSLIPGEVFLGPNGQLAAKCSQGAIGLLSLQLAGKKELSGSDFLRGQKDLVGQILK
ncbi:MAG: methionyl-tRNA formyltransferase [Patescibacteria group bacterium]